MRLRNVPKVRLVAACLAKNPRPIYGPFTTEENEEEALHSLCGKKFMLCLGRPTPICNDELSVSNKGQNKAEGKQDSLCSIVKTS